MAHVKWQMHSCWLISSNNSIHSPLERLLRSTFITVVCLCVVCFMSADVLIAKNWQFRFFIYTPRDRNSLTHKPAEFDFIPIPFPRLASHHYLFAMCTVLEFSKLFLHSPRSNESINVVTERPFEIFFIFREDLFCKEERSGNGLRQEGLKVLLWRGKGWHQK